MTTRVAYQGRPGAFSELAVRRFRPDAEPVPCGWFDDVAETLLSSAAGLAVLPIHNTLAGVITESCALLADDRIVVLDELVLPVSHALLAAPGTEIRHIRYVLSHPAALAQCRRFINRHGLEAVPTQDTAGAVEKIMHNRLPHTAAIASTYAAKYHGAEILAETIQDSPENHTLFVLLAASPSSQADSNFQFGLLTKLPAL